MSELQTQYEAHKARRARLNGTYREELPLREEENERADKLERRIKVLELALGDLQKRFNSIRIERREEGEEKLVTVGEPTRPTVKQIKKAVQSYFGLSDNDLDSQCRTAKIGYARHMLMFLCRELTLKSFPEIGRLIGNRDHTTILHGYGKLKKRVQSDWIVAADAAMIEQMIEQLMSDGKMESRDCNHKNCISPTACAVWGYCLAAV